MSDENKKKGGKGKVIAIVCVIIVLAGLAVFFIMGAVKRSKEGPGQGGPGKRPPRDSGQIEMVVETADAGDFYIAA